MIKPIAFVWLLFSCVLGYTQDDQNIYITVIPLDTTQTWSWHVKGNGPAVLTAGQVRMTDSLLTVCILENNNNGKPGIIGKHIGIHTFKKQLVPSVNFRGETVVWVNCFGDGADHNWAQDIDWRKEIVEVNDGGEGGSLFNVLINLTTGKYEDLYVNGI